MRSGFSRCVQGDVGEAPYSGCMRTANPAILALRMVIDAHRGELEALLAKYKATNPRLFGSVARGDAHEGSDIDIVVEMDPVDGNLLMRASGLMEETRQLFDRDDVDIFPVQLLKRPISESALADAVALRRAASRSAWPNLLNCDQSIADAVPSPHGFPVDPRCAIAVSQDPASREWLCSVSRTRK